MSSVSLVLLPAVVAGAALGGAPQAFHSALDVAVPSTSEAAATLKTSLKGRQPVAPMISLTEQQLAVFGGPKERPITLRSTYTLTEQQLAVFGPPAKRPLHSVGASTGRRTTEPAMTLAERVAAIESALKNAGVVDPVEERIFAIEERLRELGLMVPLSLEEKVVSLEATLGRASLPSVAPEPMTSSTIPSTAPTEHEYAEYPSTAPTAPTKAELAAIVANIPSKPFPVPTTPAGFAGAQWAPTEFPPFVLPVDVAPVAVQADAPVPEAPAPSVPPPAEPEASTTPGHFAVTLKTPDGDLKFQIPPDAYILDHTDELAEEDDAFADLPYACRAGSCSACTAKVISGKVDNSDGSFLSDEQKAAGFVLSCTAKVLSDAVLQTHMEDELN